MTPEQRIMERMKRAADEFRKAKAQIDSLNTGTIQKIKPPRPKVKPVVDPRKIT